MKRFYQTATVATAEGGFIVALDGKPLRTPAKQALVVGSRALAEAIAAEWQAQAGEVRPNALPLTRLASTAIDLVTPRRDEIVAGIAKYAGTDLLCYRATHPPELAERQHRAWQPLLDWLEARYGAPLGVTAGIVPRPQPEASLAALGAAVAAHDAMTLAALHLATASCGSVVLALALVEQRIDAETAFALSQLDESFEIEQWGEDEEQTRRRAALREDVRLAARFLELLRTG
ncbi:MAG TPA: ATP12 family protein [Stellaceae bacterium]|nr:ATP12 family protein [Stellaceae bacterium]